MFSSAMSHNDMSLIDILQDFTNYVNNLPWEYDALLTPIPTIMTLLGVREFAKQPLYG